MLVLRGCWDRRQRPQGAGLPLAERRGEEEEEEEEEEEKGRRGG